MNPYKIIAATTLAAAFLGFVPLAGARSISAWSGKPEDSHYLPCFTENALSATNTCTPTAIWQIPLPVDAAQAYAPSINVGGSSATGNVACQTGALYVDSTSAASFTTERVSSNGAATTLKPGTVSVPGAGTLSVDCWVSQNGRINSVNW